MELEEYGRRLTAAQLRETDEFYRLFQNLFSSRVFGLTDEKGRFQIKSEKELFDYEKVINRIKGIATNTEETRKEELEHKLERAEWVRQEAQRRLAERRKMNGNKIAHSDT